MVIFKNESKIKAIGGRLEDEYNSLRKSILIANANYLPIFLMLGIKDVDIITDTILSESTFADAAKDAYVEYMTKLVENGTIPIESLLTQKTINKAMPTPEAKKKQLNREIQRTLIFRFKETYNQYFDLYKPSTLGINRVAIKVSRQALSIGDNGYIIDVEQFISLYRERMKVNTSEMKRLHEEACNALNAFFGGSFVITKKELAKYFTIDGGQIKPNPESVNKDSYSRLAR
jgi:hypothetical protein